MWLHNNIRNRDFFCGLWLCERRRNAAEAKLPRASRDAEKEP